MSYENGVEDGVRLRKRRRSEGGEEEEKEGEKGAEGQREWGRGLFGFWIAFLAPGARLGPGTKGSVEDTSIREGGQGAGARLHLLNKPSSPPPPPPPQDCCHGLIKRG